ncbi:MAG: DsbE family thiol:disulfide interchange protein [Arenicellales bacterium WSBS_2016_MAG_OTU3]
MKARFLIPLVVFISIVIFLGIGLTKDPRKLPSTFIDKPAPPFSLPNLKDPDKRFSTAGLQGEVWLLNIWASWCSACFTEHNLIKELAVTHRLNIVGLNYKDTEANANNWLQQLGNPYSAIPFDADGAVGIEWGVYGVPETFVIDKQGIIRYKQIGPVTQDAIEQNILPLVKQLEQETA